MKWQNMYNYNLKKTMTSKELEKIEKLTLMVENLSTLNSKLVQSVNSRIEEIETKVSKNYEPVSLEKIIISQISQSVNESIKSHLSGYNTPFAKIITKVMNENEEKVTSMVRSSFDSILSTKEFRKEVNNAFISKLAKNIVSMNDSLLDTTHAKLKNDPIFKSKVILAVNNVVEQFLKEEK